MNILIFAFFLALIASVQCYPYPTFEHIEEITVNPLRLMSEDMAELLRHKRDYGAGAMASASSLSNAYAGDRGGYPQYGCRY